MKFQIIKQINLKLVKVVLFVVLISSFFNSTNNLVVAQVLPGNDKAVSMKWESTSATNATITWTPPVNSGKTLVKYLLTVNSEEVTFVDIIDQDVGLATTYSLSDLVQGKNYTVKVKPVFNITSFDYFNFEKVFIQKYFTQPIVVEFGVITGSERIIGDHLTKIPVDANIFIRIKDDKNINFTTKEVILKNKNGDIVPGSNSTAPLVPEDLKQIDLIFDPDNALNADEKYSVSLNVIDSDAKTIFPINFIFKTDKTFVGYASDDPKENPNAVIRNKNPHGAFIKNENACFGCHGTQKSLSLDGDIKTIQEATTNFCLTCHDGTVATSVGFENNKFQHGFKDGVSKMGTAQCSDCHDSHLGWSKSNPNSIKSRLVYNHKKKNGEDILKTGIWVGVVDSASTINCYTCHKEKTGKVINLATVDAAGNDYYQFDAIIPFKNSKMATTKGKEADVTLCLSCHQSGGKGKNIKDIYLNQNSGHKIIFEDRNDELGGGLEGYLSCSDCHETHGSDNIYLLKKELGHKSTNGIYATSATNPSEWTPTEERAFCKKCHNGATLTYGVIGELKKKNAKDEDIFGHQDSNDNISCSSCHGPNGINDILGAAHAPMKIIPATP
ncbi:MAG: cytochrome family protein [Bacillales bacterium]|jgi:hypothetical protein|nr:cytochrome family protein [Bacillales bacterium]